MKVIEVRVETKRQVTEWEYDVVGLKAVPEEGESTHDVIRKLKSLCLGSSPVEEVQLEMELAYAGKNKKKEDTKQKVKEEPAKEEVVKEEVVKEVVVKEEVVKEEPKKRKTRAKAPVFEKYDRENDLHKKHVGSHFDIVLPAWRKNPAIKAGVVYASKTIAEEAVDFMDSNGVLLAPFFDRMEEIANEYFTANNTVVEWVDKSKK